MSRPRLLVMLFLTVPLILLGAEGCDPVPGSVPFDPPVETGGDDDDGEVVDDDDDDEPVEPVEPPVDPPVEPPVDPPVEPGPSLVQGVSITGVSLYQAVEVPLTVAGEGRAGPTDEAESEMAPTPIIAGRDALVRVYVALEPGYAMQSVNAEFFVDDGSGPVTITSSLVLRSDSTPDDLGSTFNATLPGELLTPVSTLSVHLLADEPASTDEPAPGGSEGATWPGTDTPAPLGAIENGGSLSVRIVPLQYAPDGSDRLPDVSAEQIDLMQSWLHRLYPATVVTVTVDAPLVVINPVLAGGDGWSDALYQLTDLREDRIVPADEYVYGMVTPMDTAANYCRGGCVSGLGWRASDPMTAYTRTSLGLGYPGESAADTFVHEIGHNHGRMHAPCGNVSGADPEYPHGDGRLGVWGYDSVEDALVSPSEFADMMGYCRPRWVSDYTWSALSDRIAWVNASAYMVPAPGWPQRLRVLDVNVGGRARLHGSVSVDRPSSGPKQKIEVLNARGVVIGTVMGIEQRFEDNGSRAILFAPPADPAAVAVRLPGGAPLTL